MGLENLKPAKGSVKKSNEWVVVKEAAWERLPQGAVKVKPQGQVIRLKEALKGATTLTTPFA